MAVQEPRTETEAEVPASPIDLPSIPDVIYRELRRDIARGIYKPGPIRVRVIAERFGVSATPVREALRRLEAEGLVSLRNRQIVINQLSREEMREIYTIRGELESFALRQAVPNVKNDPELIAELESLIEDMDTYEHKPEEWRAANEDFHWLLYRAAAMPRLESIINQLWVAVEPYLRLYVSTAKSFRTAQDQHRKILEHVRRGEAATAAKVMKEHLHETRDLLSRGLSDAAVQ
jgi:DNA-binding GntR family transcriptional regulator